MRHFTRAVVILLLPSSIWAQQSVTASRLDSLLQLAIEANVQHEYEQAEQLILKARRLAPQHPLPVLLRAATVYARMQDLENFAREDELLALLDSARSLAQQNLSARPSPDALFCLGAAETYLAYGDLRRNRYFSAYRHGLRAKSFFEQALALDSTYCDARVGLNSLLYWRSKALRFLSWLPFISDRRSEAIEHILRAYRCTRLTRWTTVSNLSWILLDAGQPEQALRWAQLGLTRFPNSRFFLWPAGEAYSRLARWAECEQIFARILEGLKRESESSGYNELICYLKIARCRKELGDLVGALQAVDGALAVRVADGVERRAEHLFDQARKLREEIQRELRERARSSNP